jgi:hypothetical protein
MEREGVGWCHADMHDDLKMEQPELRADAWERFERAVDVVAKSSARHRSKATAPEDVPAQSTQKRSRSTAIRQFYADSRSGDLGTRMSISAKSIIKDWLPPALLRAAMAARNIAKLPVGSLKPVVMDDTMSWMAFINPGMVYGGNLALFSYCIEHLPSGAPLIEIGSFAGLSLNYLILFLRRAGRTNPVFSVDDWKFEDYPRGELIEGVPFEAYRAHVVETFRRNVTLFSGDRLPHHIELDSDAFFAAWAAREARSDYFGNSVRLGGPIAFAYIDGAHNYAQSKRDFENVDRHLQSGGFIVFDDSADESPYGSKRTAQEAAALSRYEVIAKNPNYCLRKRAS